MNTPPARKADPTSHAREAAVFLLWLVSFPLAAVLAVAWNAIVRATWGCFLVSLSIRRIPEEIPRCQGFTWWLPPLVAWTVLMVVGGVFIIRWRRRT